MIEQILSFLTGIIVGTISETRYVGIALLMAIESACIPLPSEVIMPFAGYLVSLGKLDLVLVATAGAIGCNIGSAVAYFIGLYGGRPFIERWGGYVLVGTHELDIAEAFFRRYGSATVFIARLLPVVRTFIAFPAGMARMPQVKFHLYTFAGSWPWCYGLAYIGMKLGERWNSDPRIREIFHQFDAVIVGVLLLAAAWYIWTHVKKRKKTAKN
ncbi:MAG: DedA family protein [Rhodospirillales bacterium]|nr:DedA family protein [Rhodospirillales bacterium]